VLVLLVPHFGVLSTLHGSRLAGTICCRLGGIRLLYNNLALIVQQFYDHLITEIFDLCVGEKCPMYSVQSI